MSYQNIVVETKGRVGIIRLNRPQALNALNKALIEELTAAVEAFDADDKIGCMLITGTEKAFAAGADIKEMADKPLSRPIWQLRLGLGAPSRMHASRWSRRWPVSRSAAAANSPCNAISSLRRTTQSSVSPKSSSASSPALAARRGLTRAVGKAKAMDMILTGRMMDAAEAERSGLVARVVPAASLMDEAMKVAETIANMSLPSVLAGKEAINARSRRRSRKASRSSGASSIRCSQRKIRRKE